MLLSSQRGFSLPELMVAVGLLGGVSVLTMKLMEDQSNNQAMVKFNTEISKNVALISTAMTNPTHCRSMMTGVQRLAGAGFSMNNLTLTTRAQDSSTKTTVFLDTTNTTQKDFYVTAGDIRVKNSDYGTNFAELEITYRKRRLTGARFWGSSALDTKVIKRIPFLVRVDGANNILSCGPIVSEGNVASRRRMCDTMATTGLTVWDAATATCRLNAANLNCPPGYVPNYQASLGSMSCVLLRNQLNLYDVFDTQTNVSCSGRPNWRLTTGLGGRLRIECN